MSHHHITTLWLYQLWESDNVNLANLSLGSEWELNRWRAPTVTYKFVGIKITSGDRWKQVAIEKTYENKHKVKEICLFSKPFTINITWRIVCKNYWKTIWISHHGWLLSLKMCYFEKSLNILFWNWKKYTAIIKWISVTFISKWLHFDFQTIHRSPRNLKVSTVINYLQGMEIWRAHVSQCF